MWSYSSFVRPGAGLLLMFTGGSPLRSDWSISFFVSPSLSLYMMASLCLVARRPSLTLCLECFAHLESLEDRAPSPICF